jgi:hypothetical protein
MFLSKMPQAVAELKNYLINYKTSAQKVKTYFVLLPSSVSADID